MFRRLSNLSLCAIAITLAFAGCQKSLDQPSSSATDPNPSPSTAEKVKSAVREAVAPKPIIVPAETAIQVTLDQSLSSKTATSGQAFAATVEAPIELEGKVAIPKGARASGIVKDAKAAGRFKGGSVLSLTLTSVTVQDTNYDIRTSAPTFSHKGKGKRTAVAVGGGGALGALIGGIAGGGKAPQSGLRLARAPAQAVPLSPAKPTSSSPPRRP